MGLLNRLFGSTESIAKEIKANEESIIKHWKDYLGTISRKTEIIDELCSGANFQSNLQELKELLELELVDISSEEKDESELISDLDAVEHSKKVKRVHTLARCLGYAATKYEYAHKLLHMLHSILKSQMHLVVKLQKGSKNTEKLISHLKSQSELELEIQEKIAKLETYSSWKSPSELESMKRDKTKKIETFHNLFLALVKGEHIIQTMDSEEKQLLKEMQETFSKVVSGEIGEGVLYAWAMTVFNSIEDKIHEAVATGMFRGYQPDSDFEFVNRPEFVDLVKESIPHKKLIGTPKKMTPMINVFVHLFREWYNHERTKDKTLF